MLTAFASIADVTADAATCTAPSAARVVSDVERDGLLAAGEAGLHRFPASDASCHWRGQALGIMLVHVGKTGGESLSFMMDDANITCAPRLEPRRASRVGCCESHQTPSRQVLGGARGAQPRPLGLQLALGRAQGVRAARGAVPAHAVHCDDARPGGARRLRLQLPRLAARLGAFHVEPWPPEGLRLLSGLPGRAAGLRPARTHSHPTAEDTDLLAAVRAHRIAHTLVPGRPSPARSSATRSAAPSRAPRCTSRPSSASPTWARA